MVDISNHEVTFKTSEELTEAEAQRVAEAINDAIGSALQGLRQRIEDQFGITLTVETVDLF